MDGLELSTDKLDLANANGAKSVLVFDFGSAMLRLTVPILGTTPARIPERSQRFRSRHKHMGFAGDSYSSCAATWLGHRLLEGYRLRNCDEASRGGVRVGAQRSSLTREIL